MGSKNVRFLIYKKHMIANLSIDFSEDYTIAYARSNLFVANGLEENRDLGQVFSEGGYYYWTFRKDPQSEQWRIKDLFLDVNWTSGDSRGLNEPGAADP